MAEEMDLDAMLDVPFQAKEQNSRVENATNSAEHGTSERESKETSDRKKRWHSDTLPLPLVTVNSDRDDDRSSSRSSNRHRHRSHSRSRRSHSRDRHSSKSHRDRRSRSRGHRRSSRSKDTEIRRPTPPRGDRRRKSRSPTGRRSRSRSKLSDRRVRSPSPALPEEERDKRTVFVTQLAARLRSRELSEFFSQAGRVRDARIISDRNSRRSKGCVSDYLVFLLRPQGNSINIYLTFMGNPLLIRVGYVEFHEEESVQKALAMTGQKLLGIPVMVQLTEAEKNRLALQAEQTVAIAKPIDMSYHRLYVGSIHFNLTEDDLKQIFEPFGPLEFVNLHKDPETGRSRGFAFIQYKNGEDAKQALEKMNGFELFGRNVLIIARPATNFYFDNENINNSSLSSFSNPSDMTGMSMNSQSRVELMNKLAARENDLPMISSNEIPPVIPPKLVVQNAMPSKTILLNNMFNPAESVFLVAVQLY
ncbi:hypothetical protein BC937DRAFT_95466 [Endogone sp. FLAS-F59071]|nr:hypothetical protein BC937DRAFT_95466 [Endogone sp. FLAS-F59071]|eukprot:RUS20336.1 hypothetical protein BC937DRAFT_95466 [Endogone sp. FLAS-F59071]